MNSLRFQASGPCVGSYGRKAFTSNIDAQQCRIFCRKRRSLPLCSLTLQSPSDAAPPSTCEPSSYTSIVGSSSLHLSHWNLTQRHLTVLNVFACVTAIGATWLFCSAIPTLLAFKRAAESMEKLMDATREELPNTMAAIRLSGMEISDLTTELSDLGQEITQGVRSSTRAVRLAEQRLRRLTNMSPSVSLQALTSTKAEPEPDPGGPVVARTARGLREGIVKGRAMLQMLFNLTRLSRFALKWITGRR